MSANRRGSIVRRRRRSRLFIVPMAGLLVMASTASMAQDAGSAREQGRLMTVVPRLSLTETLTDNVRLSSADRQSEQITEISPGISVKFDGDRLKGFFDYALNQVVYANNSSPSRTQNALSAAASLEAIEDWAYIDFGGQISQQMVSAFGLQSIDNTSVNANRAEVSSYRISPYVRGRLGDMSSYEARYSRTVTGSDSAVMSDLTTEDGTLRFRGGSAFSDLGWSADTSRQRTQYGGGRSTQIDSLSLGLTYAVTPQLTVSANAGREANNFSSLENQSYDTSGVGLSWSPSVTTRFSVTRNQRSFGDTHNLSFEHRTERTIWRVSDSKDVLAAPGQTGFGNSGSIYDLLYNQFAAVEPNPGARAQLVNAYLQANGISPNAVVINSFLTSSLSLQRRQDVSFALLGARDTITFLASRSQSTRLDTVSTGTDDFNASAVVRQRGLTVNYSHRLTPDYALGVLVSQQNTTGDQRQQDLSLRFINISVSGKLGRRGTMSIAVRRVSSSGSASAYTENAVSFGLGVRF